MSEQAYEAAKSTHYAVYNRDQYEHSLETFGKPKDWLMSNDNVNSSVTVFFHAVGDDVVQNHQNDNYIDIVVDNNTNLLLSIWVVHNGKRAGQYDDVEVKDEHGQVQFSGMGCLFETSHPESAAIPMVRDGWTEKYGLTPEQEEQIRRSNIANMQGLDQQGASMRFWVGQDQVSGSWHVLLGEPSSRDLFTPLGTWLAHHTGYVMYWATKPYTINVTGASEDQESIVKEAIKASVSGVKVTFNQAAYHGD